MENNCKTNLGLVEYCEAQLGLPYWYGTFGQLSTKSLLDYKKKQYPRYYTGQDYLNQLGLKVHDCVGLIKGYFWCTSPKDSKPKYPTSKDEFPDVSANGLYEWCHVKSTDMKQMPDVPGICVFMNGHVGVYIGKGEVIEAMNHRVGVVKTKLKNRQWTRWAYLNKLCYKH